MTILITPYRWKLKHRAFIFPVKLFQFPACIVFQVSASFAFVGMKKLMHQIEHIVLVVLIDVGDLGLGSVISIMILFSTTLIGRFNYVMFPETLS